MLYEDMDVFKKSHQLVLNVYRITEKFPRDERFRLVDQMIRAAYSIPSNIAEGCSRSSQKDFKHFLEIALGSAFELETQLVIIEELDIVPEFCTKLTSFD